MIRNRLVTKLLYAIPLVFLLLATVRITLNYHDNERNIDEFVHRQARSLNSFMLAHRNYYQNLYLTQQIPLNEKTLAGLPAFSALEISRTFSQTNSFGVTIQTVSDRARNPKNQANVSERKALDYFRSHPEQKEYFLKEGDSYRFATPLYVEKKCLMCHGKKEDAPLFITQKYSAAYGYRLGELRGIVSISLPTQKVRSFFDDQFLKSLIYDLILTVGVIGLTLFLLRYFKTLNERLEEEVDEKTKTLQQNLAFFESHKLAMDQSSIVSKSDIHGKITYVNDAFCAISGYTREELIGQPHRVIRHPDQDPRAFRSMWKNLNEGKTWKGVLQNLSKSGETYWVDMTITPIFDAQGEIVEYIAVRHDITQQILKTAELDKRAHIDPLTGLWNRVKLLNELDGVTNHPSLAIINVDNFRQVNDFYGHQFGDQVIAHLAGLIVTTLEDHAGYIVYHLQGDEFVIVHHEISKPVFIDTIQRVVRKVNLTDIDVEGEVVSLSLSASISFEEPSALLTTADMGLKIAKKEKKDCVVYTPDRSFNEEYKNNILVTKQIKDALLEGRIVPYFQPIFNPLTQTIEKYESLVRMVCPDGTVKTPYFFLDVAKQTKYYHTMTKIMIEKTFDAFKDQPYEFSINLTMDDIMSEPIRNYIITMLEIYHIANRVVFEIVESQEVDDSPEVTLFIDRVKEYGCKIAIDDFGTGYSNFSYLMKLKADYIKIDASLIKNLTTSQEAQAVVTTIISFAQEIGMKTIAEFIENEELEKIAAHMGIDFLQGYYYGKPSPSIQ